MPVPEVSRPTFLPKPSEPVFEGVEAAPDVYKRQSYLRAKKKNDLDRIMGLYGNMNERYW